MTLLPLNLAETPNRKQRHRSSPRCPHSADVIMFGFSLFNIVRAAHKVNYMYNSCSILNWLCLVVSNSLRPHGPQSARLLCPWDSPGKKTGVGCHALLQGYAAQLAIVKHLTRQESRSSAGPDHVTEHAFLTLLLIHLSLD